MVPARVRRAHAVLPTRKRHGRRLLAPHVRCLLRSASTIRDLRIERIERIEPAATFVERDGVRLHVRDWGGSGLDVLLLHGLASTSHIWDLVAPLLAAAGCRVVAIDQRGHGLSDRPATGYGFDEVTADALAVIEETRLHRAVVGGHSWGASVALSIAARHPESCSKLVCVDGGYGGMRDRATWEQTWERMKPPRIEATREQIVAFVRNGPLGAAWSEEVETAVLSVFEEQSDGLLRARLPLAAHEEIFRSIYDGGHRAWYAALSHPALLLPTRLGPVDEWADNKKRFLDTLDNPMLRIEWLEDSIHDVPLQRPALVAGKITAFLAP